MDFDQTVQCWLNEQDISTCVLPHEWSTTAPDLLNGNRNCNVFQTLPYINDREVSVCGLSMVCKLLVQWAGSFLGLLYGRLERLKETMLLGESTVELEVRESGEWSKRFECLELLCCLIYCVVHVFQTAPVLEQSYWKQNTSWLYWIDADMKNNKRRLE